MPKPKKKSTVSLSLGQLPSDPIRAYRKGHSDGFTDALNTVTTLAVFALRDTELLKSEEDVVGFYNKFMRSLEMTRENQLSMQEVRQILKNDYNIRVKVW